jgi:TolA-binding protein
MGQRATPASDVYALAIVAYELLSGHRPFENDSPTAEAAAHVNSPVPSIAQRCENLPPELDRVFQRALAKDPRQRYSSAQELVAELRGALARSAGPTQPLVATPARRSSARMIVPLALLLLAGAIGAAVAAIVSTGGSNDRIVTQTIAGPGGTTTVRQTVTHPTTAAPAPPPPPPPVVAAGGGHSLNDQGYSRIQAGDYGGAVPLLQSAVQKLRGVGPSDPYEAYANYNLGYALYRLGRCSEAVPYLQRADQLEPQRHEPRQMLKRAERC